MTGNYAPVVPDFAIARAFVTALTGKADASIRLRFQRKGFPCFEHWGTIDALWPRIVELQAEGYSVFYFPSVIPDRPGTGRSGLGYACDADVTGFRAVFADCDNGLPDDWHLLPSLVVHTSTVLKDGKTVQKGQPLWLVSDGAALTADAFRAGQRRLIAHYGSDPAPVNPSRVLRLPGSLHLKDLDNPQMVTFEDHREFPGECYTSAQVLTGLPEISEPSHEPSAAVGKPISEAELRDILSWHNPFVPYPEWFPKLGAIKIANIIGGDEDGSKRREIALDWSRGDLNKEFTDIGGYGADDDKDVEWTYDSLNRSPDGKDGDVTTVGSLIKEAHELGRNTEPPRSDKTAEERFGGQCKAQAEKNGPPDFDYEFLEPHQFQNRPRPTYLIDQFLRSKSSHMLFGKSGTYKSFLVLELLAAITTGKEAFGHFKVYQTGDAVFFADEDPEDLMQQRWPAYCQARGIENPFAQTHGRPGRLMVIPRCPLISKGRADITNAIDGLRYHGMKPLVIAVDTFAKAMVGLEQNSNDDAGSFHAAMAHFRRELGCATLAVHHPNRADEKAFRGAGALLDDIDVVMHAAKPEQALNVQITWTKTKSIAPPKPVNLRGTLFEVPGELDQQGNQITSPSFTYAPETVTAPTGGKTSQAMKDILAERSKNFERLRFITDIKRVLADEDEPCVSQATSLRTDDVAVRLADRYFADLGITPNKDQLDEQETIFKRNLENGMRIGDAYLAVVCHLHLPTPQARRATRYWYFNPETEKGNDYDDTL